jgi:hemolysin activation/secretion protein
MGGGSKGGDDNFNLVRGGVGTVGMRSRYSVWRFGVSHAQGLPADFQLRAGLQGQYTNQALIPQEQFGYAGSAAVRGFLERELVRDRGYYGNLELYGPDWGSMLADNASVRLLAFYDFGSGTDINLAKTGKARANIASTGLGLRLNVGRTLTLRGDIGRVVTPGGAQLRGDTRGHLSLNVAF